ncbi:hypothetical protein F5Y18DRAFT_80974 [Xylariaceae sp. FL1019]|nr:hypothetical protein F5Y18DRAFT_80974 [Xylariaceae sp. FL1019]
MSLRIAVQSSAEVNSEPAIHTLQTLFLKRGISTGNVARRFTKDVPFLCSSFAQLFVFLGYLIPAIYIVTYAPTVPESSGFFDLYSLVI